MKLRCKTTDSPSESRLSRKIVGIAMIWRPYLKSKFAYKAPYLFLISAESSYSNLTPIPMQIMNGIRIQINMNKNKKPALIIYP